MQFVIACQNTCIQTKDFLTYKKQPHILSALIVKIQEDLNIAALGKYNWQ